ncbi:hypothetical protein G7Z17_g1292 [Cylindrodendrum hubeiense]|uniref:Uncharacterized protein n=1 Tax=Cylindrodendrum hubeiense TaxID=595255 RepID=A0A9P5LK90_9HYPO|nr:hypothetical protein G7Z17_g1292 [Cylindrodendrum hubeiense]
MEPVTSLNRQAPRFSNFPNVPSHSWYLSFSNSGPGSSSGFCCIANFASFARYIRGLFLAISICLISNLCNFLSECGS